MDTTFSIEIQGSGPWRNYVIYLSLAGNDSAGQRCCFGSSVFRPGETPAGAGVEASCGPCAAAEGFVSMIPASLPGGGRVEDSPPVPVEVIGRAGGREIFRRRYEANRWGGFSLAGVKLKDTE